ncbi:MAG: tetratricopeptide repeat protein [Alphaproteobacteria bacterium]
MTRSNPRTRRLRLQAAVVLAVAVAAGQQAFAQQAHAPLSVWQGSAANTDEAIALHNQGYAYARLGYYLPAIQAYDAALALAPNWASLYANRAMAYRQIGEPEKALGDVRRSIEIDPAMGRKWQEWMTELGFYAGTIDGVVGPQTNEALARWAGLPATAAQPAASR